MKTNEELIAIWNELTSSQKMAFGEKWITHETNLRAWDKPFLELSPLKRDRILKNGNIFPKKPSEKVSVIGSGIYTNTLEVNQFKNGEPVFSDSELFRLMKKDLGIKSNAQIAEIVGLTANSVKTMTQPSRELPAWAKSMIFVWKKLK